MSGHAPPVAGGDDAPTLEAGLEAFQSSAEFRGPVEALDGHACNDHFAQLYETSDEKFEAAVPFVRHGLDRGERVMYVVDESTEAEVRAELRDGGVDVDAATGSGALSFHTVQETYLRSGEFAGDEMIDFYGATIDEAAEGYTALRIVAETTWLQGDATTIEQFMQYESRVNDLFDGEDCLALCQYDRAGFRPEVVRTIVQTHPHLVYDGAACHNFYYTPPEEFFGPDEPRRENDRMLRTLRDRTVARAELQQRERFLQRLYAVTADADGGFEKRLQAVLELGREQFDLEIGGMARVDPDADLFEVEYVSGDHDHLVPGARVDLSETYCRVFADGSAPPEGAVSEPVAITDPAAEGFTDETCLADFGVDAYLGAYLHIDGGSDRTFFFVAREPRDDPITDEERTLHRLMAQWVRYEVERRQRERVLRERTEHLNALVETAPECIKTVAEDGTLLQMNAAGLDAVEATDESAVTGESVYDLIAPEHRERFREFNERICDGERGTLEFDVVGLEGARRQMETHAAPLRRPDGETAHVALTRDVTERRERERELERTLDLLERTERIADVGGWAIDPETQGVFWTDHLFELLAVDADEEPALAEALDVYHEEDRPIVEDAVEAALASGDPFDVEVRFRPATTDEVRWLRVQGVPVLVDGEVVSLRGAVQDVTERREREAELRQTKDRFETVFDRSDDGILVLDPDADELVDANPAAAEMTGHGRDELTSLRPSDLHPDGTERFRAFLDEVRENGTAWSEDLYCRHRDGHDVPTEITASAITLDGRDLVLALVRDIGERKKHERYQRALYEIIADAELATAEKIDRLLDLGRDHLDLSLGMLTRDHGDAFEIERMCGTHPDLHEGTRSPRGTENYCRRVVDDGESICVENAGAAGWDGDALHHEFGLDCYAGTTVAVGDGTYGTVFFADTETRGAAFTDAERTFLELMGRCVSYELERAEREGRLQALNALGRDLMDAESTAAVAEGVVDAAEETLDLPMTAVALYDEGTGELRPAAHTDAAAEVVEAPGVLDGTDSVAWEAFVATDERRVSDPLADADAPPSRSVTELIARPLGTHGVLLVGASAADGFGRDDVEFVETVAAGTRAVLARADRERKLQEREDTLQEQNRTLSRLNRINDTIRSLDRALVEATTRDGIEEVVCEELAASGPYELAWIGHCDGVTGEVTPVEWAGTERGYLADITITADDRPEGRGPTGRALRTGEPQVVNNVLTDESFEPWRQEALNRGYHATAAFPLSYDDTRYGVLNLYAGQPGVFDDLEREVLAELSNTIGHAINAIESKKALISDTTTELEFAVSDDSLEVVEMVRELDCEYSLKRVVPGPGGGVRAFFSVRGASADEVLDFGSRLAVSELRVVSDPDDDSPRVFEAELTDESLTASVLNHGGRPLRVVAEDGAASVTVEVAADAEVREFVEMVRSKYPDSELLAQRTRELSERTSLEFADALADELTDRQRETIQIAYYNGYFEEPRTRTGSEIADSMDIAQPTFSSLVRAGMRKLCRGVFEDGAAVE